jgi:hypothetical protein
LELNIWEGFTAGSIAAGVIATLIYSGIQLILVYTLNATKISVIYFYLRNSIAVLVTFYLATSFIATGILLWCVHTWALIELEWTRPFLASLVALLVYERFTFFRIGVRSAERSVKRGTNYTRSLDLATNGFWFLGTGANKLTTAANFRKAMARCNHSSSTVRFLLSKPTNLQLEAAEAAAGAPKGQYANKVRESLQILKRLKEIHGFHFEVRFYRADAESDIESFRMMFINDSTLLLSYNAYGHGDGSDLPQLVIFRAWSTSSKQNFFFPFRQYYERLWNSAEPWDFTEYVS